MIRYQFCLNKTGFFFKIKVFDKNYEALEHWLESDVGISGALDVIEEITKGEYKVGGYGNATYMQTKGDELYLELEFDEKVNCKIPIKEVIKILKDWHEFGVRLKTDEKFANSLPDYWDLMSEEEKKAHTEHNEGMRRQYNFWYDLWCRIRGK